MLFKKVNRREMALQSARINAIREVLEASMSRDMTAMFNRMIADFKSMYGSIGLIPDQKSRYRISLQDKMIKHMEKSANIFSRNIRDDNKTKGYRFYEKKAAEAEDISIPEDDEDGINEAVSVAIALMIEKRSEQFALEILKTNQKEMADVVRQSEQEIMSEGGIATLAAVATLAAKKLKARSVSRVKLISFQTIASTQSESSNIEAVVLNSSRAKANDVPLSENIGKNWDAILDSRTRADHIAADARYFDNPIPVEEPFSVGGESLMYPRDPNGSVGNVINCRCESHNVLLENTA